MGNVKVNRKLLPIKLHFFLINAAHSSVIPLIPVYARQMGITSDFIGHLFAVVACLNTLLKPLIGSLVDRYQKLKLVLVVLLLCDAAADLGLNFTPSLPGEAEDGNTIRCRENSTTFKFHNDYHNASMQGQAFRSMCQFGNESSVSVDVLLEGRFLDDSESPMGSDNGPLVCCFRDFSRATHQNVKCTKSSGCPYSLETCDCRLCLTGNLSRIGVDDATLFLFNNESCARVHAPLEERFINDSKSLFESNIRTVEGFQNSSYNVHLNIKRLNVSGCPNSLEARNCLACLTGNKSFLGEDVQLNERFFCLPQGLLVNCSTLRDVDNTREGDDGIDSTRRSNPTLQFWLISVFTVVMYTCLGSLVTLSDAACFHELGGKPWLYGRQRLWGTLGWGFFALLAGYLNQLFSNGSSYNFSPGFYLLVACCALDLLAVTQMQLECARVSRTIFRDVGKLLGQPLIVVFLLQVYLIGVLVAVGRVYLFWHLRTLGADQFLLGCASGVQCFLGELPFFFFAGLIIRRLGHSHTFTMSYASHAVKFLLYRFLPNPWWIVPVELLQGPCLGSFYAAMASYAKHVAPTGAEATVQGIASGVFEGLGATTGSLLGGYGFRMLGSSVTFFWFGIASIVFTVLNIFASHYFLKKKMSDPS